MNGILLIDKEPDWTSSDVVVKLRGVLHERRVGHAGTLDPMATGLLLVFVGRATKAVGFAELHDKRYRAALRLGVETDTQDTTGTILRSESVNVSEQDLEAVLARFRGEQTQIPPMYSAVRHQGKKLYEIARKGGQVERKPRSIRIDELRLAGRENGDFLLDVCCSKGTYVRTLCHDIGQALGCGGCMSALRRVASGGFRVEDAIPIAEARRLADEGRIAERLIPVDRLFDGTKRCVVSSYDEKRIRCGAEVETDLPDGTYRVYSETGGFLMLGQAENGLLRAIKRFFEV